MSATAPQSASTPTDDGESGLPAFTTFQSTELEPWDYYDRSGQQSVDPQASNYTRPWEMESKEHQQQQQQQQQLHQRGFEPFPKLPSFQSQFSFTDSNLVPEPSLPTQVTAVPVPISPSSGSPSGGSLTQLTQLTASPLSTLQPTITALPPPNFHTLAAINVQQARSYPLVPAPIQAREIPSIQQQYIDERHIQLYQPISTTATFHHPAPPQFTVIKSDQICMEMKNGHQNSFQRSPMDNGFMEATQISAPKAIKGVNGTPTSHLTKDTRKKERRKIRASSLESSTESGLDLWTVEPSDWYLRICFCSQMQAVQWTSMQTAAEIPVRWLLSQAPTTSSHQCTPAWITVTTRQPAKNRYFREIPLSHESLMK